MRRSDVTTPWSRRFTDGNKRRLAELKQHIERVAHRHARSRWAKETIAADLLKTVLETAIGPDRARPSSAMQNALTDFLIGLFQREVHIFAPVELYPQIPLTFANRVEINEHLLAQERFLDHENEHSELLVNTLSNAVHDALEALPPVAESPLTIPLVNAVPQPKELMERIILAFFDKALIDAALFTDVRDQLYANLCAASGVRPDRSVDKELVWPSKSDNRISQLVSIYLQGTPLESLFLAPCPFEIPQEQRFAGQWIIAPPGRGKTTLLHAMVAADIRTDAAVVLMDSKGDLIEPFKNMKSIADRLIIIDPDPERPIAINPLDIPKTEIGKAVELLEYLFASLLEFKLTATQSLLFRNVIRLLVTQFKSPNLDLFREILSDGWNPKYAGPVGRLDEHLKDFFRKDFDNENYSARRREVLQRLQLLLDNDAMRAMLSSAITRFTFDEELDSGKIIIINNSEERLGEQGAEFFGRFFIAHLLAAAQRRSGRKQHQKRPVFCYIDECQNVIARDEKIPTILDECRSQRIALILAHQRTTQITDENVLSALQNCAIRLANSDSEARKLSGSLRTSQEFLESLDQGQFAAYIRDKTKSAIAIGVVKQTFSPEDQLTTAEQVALKDKMLEQYGRKSSAQPVQRSPTGAPTAPASTKERDRGKKPAGWDKQ